jgi:hypothetical protein
MNERARRRRTSNRSPAYPAYDLERSIDFLVTLYENEGFGYIPLDVAVEHFGFSATSSTGQRTIAALNHFGLLQEKGSGVDRRVRLSELGKRLVLGRENAEADYEEALRDAALSPRIHGLLHTRWGGRLPSDDTLRRYLMVDLSFNPNAVESFIEDYRSTLDYAGLLERQAAATMERGGWAAPASPPGASGGEPRPFDISIPLRNGSQALLRVPVPLSEEDYDLLTSAIEANLQVMRKTIVRPAPHAVRINGN